MEKKMNKGWSGIFFLSATLIAFNGGITAMADNGNDKAFPSNTDERDIVIKTLMGEGLGEGLTGMTAIAETIRNRAAMKGITPAVVVMQPKQYSFWNDPAKAGAWIDKYGTGDAYQMAGHAYEQAFNEGSQLTDGATHYLNPKAVKKMPDWAKTYEYKGRVGSHEFYYGA